MRLLLAAASCLSALWLTGFAVAETARRPDPPKISETQDPEKKAEYLESHTLQAVSRQRRTAEWTSRMYRDARKSGVEQRDRSPRSSDRLGALTLMTAS
jgi:hypothetical protein